MDTWLIKVKPFASTTAASSAGPSKKPKILIRKKEKTPIAAAAKKEKAKHSINMKCTVELLIAHYNGNLH